MVSALQKKQRELSKGAFLNSWHQKETMPVELDRVTTQGPSDGSVRLSWRHGPAFCWNLTVFLHLPRPQAHMVVIAEFLTQPSKILVISIPLQTTSPMLLFKWSRCPRAHLFVPSSLDRRCDGHSKWLIHLSSATSFACLGKPPYGPFLVWDHPPWSGRMTQSTVELH